MTGARTQGEKARSRTCRDVEQIIPGDMIIRLPVRLTQMGVAGQFISQGDNIRALRQT
jgi:hypothetical protein